jgi:hypothetical protein
MRPGRFRGAGVRAGLPVPPALCGRRAVLCIAGTPRKGAAARRRGLPYLGGRTPRMTRRARSGPRFLRGCGGGGGGGAMGAAHAGRERLQ